MNVEQCVRVFYRRSFSSEAKDVSNSLCSYKGGNKNGIFRLAFFLFCFEEVIKLIICCVSKTHCARLIQWEVRRLSEFSFHL